MWARLSDYIMLHYTLGFLTHNIDKFDIYDYKIAIELRGKQQRDLRRKVPEGNKINKQINLAEHNPKERCHQGSGEI